MKQPDGRRVAIVMLWTIAALLGIALGLMLMAGCSSPPQSGAVTAKRYSAPYTWVELQCVAYDKNGMCSIHIPITHNEPAEYQLCLRGDAGDSGHDKAGCLDVDQPTWDRYQVGDHYPDAR